MSRDEKQNTLRLAFGVHRGPQDAPAKVLRQIDSEAQAVAVSIRAGRHKLAYVAACLGVSESYVSLIRAGKRDMPERLVAAFCAATGSNLLAQYLALEAALGEVSDVKRLADELRAAA